MTSQVPFVSNTINGHQHHHQATDKDKHKKKCNTHARSHLTEHQPKEIMGHHYQLPNEIIALIVSLLSEDQGALYRCTLVSKLFYASANPMLWQAPNVTSNQASPRFLACIAAMPPQRLAILGRYVRQLQLASLHWMDNQLILLAPHLRQLTRITIRRLHYVTDTSFQHLLQHCRHLRSLDLSYTQLTQDSFAAIGQHCHHLDDFECALWQRQSPEWLALILACPLKRLKITSIHASLNKNTVATLKRFTHLTCLEITDVNFAHTHLLLAPPSNSHPDTLPWPQLTKLALFPSYHLDDDTLLSFAKAHPHLQEVRLMYAKQLTDAALRAMAQWLPMLTRVTLTDNQHISWKGIEHLIHQCHGLAFANFNDGGQLVDTPFSVYGGGNLTSELDQHAIDTIRLGIKE